jgi:hypothetical protein
LQEGERRIMGFSQESMDADRTPIPSSLSPDMGVQNPPRARKKKGDFVFMTRMVITGA